MDALKPHLTGFELSSKSIFSIWTVMGDLHDIGKNIAAIMQGEAGHEVINLGIDVDSTKFVQRILEKPKVNVEGISALLTTTMLEMKSTIDTLKQAGARDPGQGVYWRCF